MRTISTALAIFLWVVSARADTGNVAAGQTTYASECARCHATATRIVKKIPGATAAEKTDWLAAFLPEHHLAESAGQADLIAYLLSL